MKIGARAENGCGAVVTPVYVDTSALAKWYVPESRSDDFEAWIRRRSAPTISSLTVVEMRCLLARRRRNRSLDREDESRANRLFRLDIDQRHLIVEPVADGDVRAAAHLIDRFPARPLRALDAIHLTICTARGMEHLATADSIMAAAAEELGIEVTRFD